MISGYISNNGWATCNALILSHYSGGGIVAEANIRYLMDKYEFSTIHNLEELETVNPDIIGVVYESVYGKTIYLRSTNSEVKEIFEEISDYGFLSDVYYDIVNQEWLNSAVRQASSEAGIEFDTVFDFVWNGSIDLQYEFDEAYIDPEKVLSHINDEVE